MTATTASGKPSLQDKRSVPWFQQLGGTACAHGLIRGIKLLDVEIAHYDRSADPSQPEYQQPCIFVFWHEYLALAVSQWAFHPITMLVSQHRDAEWLNQTAERLGFSIVRGSTRRGGSRAIRILKRHCQTRSLAITPDGPRGPRRRMAMGPVFLASLFKMPIVPVGFGYRKPWRLNTWDRFAVAKPFSRVRVVMGPKIYLPPRLARSEMEDHRRRIEVAVNTLTQFAESWADEGFKVDGAVQGRLFQRQSQTPSESPEASPPRPDLISGVRGDPGIKAA